MRATHDCTLEVPVLVGNRSYFADPFSFVLREHGTRIPCSSITPVSWNLGGDWYCASPKVVLCSHPKRLQPNNLKLHPADFTAGLGHGLYSGEQMEQMRRVHEAIHSRKAVAATHTLQIVDPSQHGESLSDQIQTTMASSVWSIVSRFILPPLGVLVGVLVASCGLSMICRARTMDDHLSNFERFVGSLTDTLFSIMTGRATRRAHQRRDQEYRQEGEAFEMQDLGTEPSPSDAVCPKPTTHETRGIRMPRRLVGFLPSWGRRRYPTLERTASHADLHLAEQGDMFPSAPVGRSDSGHAADSRPPTPAAVHHR